MKRILQSDEKREMMQKVQNDLFAEVTSTTTDRVMAETALRLILGPLGGRIVFQWVTNLEQAEKALEDARIALSLVVKGMIEEEFFDLSVQYRERLTAHLVDQCMVNSIDGLCWGDIKKDMLKAAKRLYADQLSSLQDEGIVPTESEAIRVMMHDTWFEQAKNQGELVKRLLGVGKSLGKEQAKRFIELFDCSFVDGLSEAPDLALLTSLQLCGVGYGAQQSEVLFAVRKLIESAFAVWVFPDRAILMAKPIEVKIDDGRLIGISWGDTEKTAVSDPATVVN